MGSGILVLNLPGVYLVDADGNMITLADGDAIGSAEGLILMGKDGSNARFMRVAADGTVRIDPIGTTTQPISAASLPLPTGAATEATLATRAAAATQTDGSQKTQINDGANVLDVNASGQAGIQDPPNLDVALSTRATASAQTDGTQKTQINDGANVLDVNATGQAAIQNPPNLDVALSTRATEATLASIKDTDGVKKITDPLPAGTNEIGKVGQGSKASPANGWPFVLYDATGNAVGVFLDGAVYRIRAESKIVRASDGAQINPSREETLVSIKDTDGIKKIQDGLPTGTNEIGLVGQGTKAAAADAWPFYVVDNTGNVVGVVLDDTVYRFQTDSKIAKGASSLVHLDAIDTTTGMGRLKATIYTPDGDPVAFGATSSSLKNDYVKNGGSSNLLVDGSTTPVVFTYLADSTYDVSLQEIRFTMAANGITFGNGYFGATAGPLTNGLLVEIVSDGSTITLFNIQRDEHFINFASPGGWEWIVSNKDVMTSAYLIGGGVKLHAGTGDQVKITVRDDIDTCALYFECFVKGNLLMGT